MKRKRTGVIALIILYFFPAAKLTGQQPDSSYRQDIRQFQHKRDSLLGALTSPLNLVRILPLKKGENTFGSAADNVLVFPGGTLPDHAGTYFLEKDTVFIQLEKGIAITSGKQLAAERTSVFPAPVPVNFSFQTLHWYITRAGSEFAIRVLDAESPYRKVFRGVDRYPIDQRWSFPGVFEPVPSFTSLPVKNVLGGEDERTIAGVVSFSYQGKTYELEAFDTRDALFISFSDLTGENGSYAFRFLHIPKPGADGKLVVDFNKAVNPNCAFSPHAPCPLPPASNRLGFAIPAGEKKYTAP